MNNQNAVPPPVPENEMERLLNLSDYNLDYSDFEDTFKQLAKLAAKITGTEISLVNLIDSYTQWTIAYHGLKIEPMDREDSVCQYTIMEENNFEVRDLSADERFKGKFYVKDDPSLRYYFGVPLKSDGYNIGALCVLDKKSKDLTPEKIELLGIIGAEIVNRLKAYKAMGELRTNAEQAKNTQAKIVHDIRGPLAGIIGLTEIISSQGMANNIDEVLEFIKMIHQSSKSLVELADEILGYETNTGIGNLESNKLTLESFKTKLIRLYEPQAKAKQIMLKVDTFPSPKTGAFSKNKLLQITGNLISNAIKFTPPHGEVYVTISLSEQDQKTILIITVKDNGQGMHKDTIQAIMEGSVSSSIDGTGGEKGYGFGLSLVKQLIEGLKGSLNIESKFGEGSIFIVSLPVGPEGDRPLPGST